MYRASSYFSESLALLNDLYNSPNLSPSASSFNSNYFCVLVHLENLFKSLRIKIKQSCVVPVLLGTGTEIPSYAFMFFSVLEVPLSVDGVSGGATPRLLLSSSPFLKDIEQYVSVRICEKIAHVFQDASGGKYQPTIHSQNKENNSYHYD